MFINPQHTFRSTDARSQARIIVKILLSSISANVTKMKVDEISYRILANASKLI